MLRVSTTDAKAQAQSGVKIEGRERKPVASVPDLVVVEPAEVERRKKLAAGVVPEKKPVEAEEKQTWFPNSKCPHQFQNSIVCRQNNGGC